MASRDSLVGILHLIQERRKRLLQAALGIGLLTAVVTLFLPDYYQSQTIFYAASTNMSNPDDLFSASSGKTMVYFGTGPDRDRLLSIAGSMALFDRMIDSFDLFSRYDINPDHRKAREWARMALSKHYEVMETKFDGILIKVEDKDPEVAAAMANGARTFIDAIALEYLRNSQQRVLNTLWGSINAKQEYLNILGDSLTRVQQETGVYDAREQNRMIGFFVSQKTVDLAGDRAKLEMYRKIGYNNRDTIANITARIAGLETELADLTGKTSGQGFDIARFNTGTGLVALLQQQHENTKNQLSYEIEKANHLKAGMTGEAMAIIPFEDALPAVSKHRPQRLMIVLTSVFLTLLFGILFFVVWDHFRNEMSNYKHEVRA